MYGIGNVEKFLRDKGDDISPQRKRSILRRARKQAKPDGILMGGMAKDLWHDEALMKEFSQVIVRDPEHIEIGVEALRKRRAS